jgi:hypothetical protein
MCAVRSSVGMWESAAVRSVCVGVGGVHVIVFGRKDMSVSGTVVQRPWNVVSRTESSALPALFPWRNSPQ